MYHHDETYDILKRIKEGVQANYTSSQYLKTLDHFIWAAISPIIELNPELFQNYVAKVVGAQLNRTLKMTSSDRKLLPTTYMAMLVAESAEQKIEAAKQMFLNRGLLFSFLTLFENITEEYYQTCLTPYQSALTESTRLQASIQLCNNLCVEHQDLYPLIVRVRFWTKEAYRFKNIIVEKYTRMAINNARRTYIDCGGKMRLGDIIGIYLITLSKAIDRCDSRHGVLTTFIQSWFRGARTRVMNAIIDDYSEESLDAKIEEQGDSILGTADSDDMMEATQLLSKVAREVDRDGVVRTMLGIPEIPSNQDYVLLQLLKVQNE